ncbi:MAG TPA: ribonuclease R [Pirellulales bacterium]|nr:ribonuclease R [Pirellulales bacterium]
MAHDEPGDLEQALLELVNRSDYRPVKPKLLVKRLHVAQDDVHELKRTIKKLVKRGLLTYGPNHLVQAGAGVPAQNRITGVFRRAAAGFGFVRPSGVGAEHTREQDIYIAADDSGDAASGDTVLVRMTKDRGGRFRNPRGAIVEVLERDTHSFVGTYFEAGGLGMVQVDGTVFAKPVTVGDPGAKNAQVGEKVVFEMVRFPSHLHDGEGVITEVLGARGDPGVDTMSIIREFNLPEHFGEDVLDAAREEADKFDESIGPGRTDFTHEVVVTIDPVDARDFDDAISLLRLSNGHWMLGVHIADVSHFVKPGTALDREAHKRATSVYLPDRVLPMLPEVISNGLASLQPGRVRYTKTAMIEFTGDGARVAVDLHAGAIRSRHRFTYEEIDDYLANPKKWKEQLPPEVFELVARMHELAMMLRARRFKRGSLELSLDSVKVDLDKNGRVVGAHREQNSESHQIIEEFMLAANEAVADSLAEADLHFLRRVHHAPDPRRLKALTDFVKELGYQTDSLESRFEIQRLLNEVADKPERQAVNYAILRSLAQAVYSPEVEGHYALASDCYCHFTSPIRRYPDLTIHRLIDGILKNKKPRNDLTELVVLGQHCSDRERRAEAAERELTKVKLLDYLGQRIGEEMDAVVTGVEEYGLFAQGIALPAEGMIHVSSLADDFYSFDRRTHSLSGRRSGNSFRLGDVIRVAVARVDVDRRELDLRVVTRDDRGPVIARPKRDSVRLSARAGKPGRGGYAGKKSGGGKAKDKKRKKRR